MKEALDNEFLQACKLVGRGRTKEALVILHRLDSQDKADSAVYCTMAVCYIANKAYKQALVVLNKVLGISATNSQANFLIGVCYANLRSPLLASQHFEIAHRLGYNRGVDLIKQWAEVLMVLGKFDKANVILMEAYTKKPDPLIIWLLVCSKRFKQDNLGLLKEIQTRLRDPLLEKMDVLRLHFARAKLLDDLKQYDDAFKSYKSANDLIHADCLNDLQSSMAWEKKVKETLTPQVIARCKEGGNDQARPVFVVGMPHSGMTLCERVIASHSEVLGLGQNDLIRRQFKKIPHVDHLNAQRTKHMADMYLQYTEQRNKKGALRTVEFDFSHYYYIGLMRAMFPNSVIIHCRRHPLDVCLGIYFQFHRFFRSYNTDLEQLVQFYKSYDRMIQYYVGQCSESVYTHRYEEFVGDPQHSGKALLAHCQLKWESSCLNFYNNDAKIYTASAWDVRQPIFDDHVKRYKHYNDHIAVLREGLRHEIAAYEEVSYA